MHNDIIQRELNSLVLSVLYYIISQRNKFKMIKIKAMDPKCKLHSSFVEHVSIKIFGRKPYDNKKKPCSSYKKKRTRVHHYAKHATELGTASPTKT